MLKTDLKEIILNGKNYQACSITAAGFGQQVITVSLHGSGTYKKLFSNFIIW